MKLPLKYNLSLFLCHLRGGGRQRGNIEKIEFLLNSSGISKEKPKKKNIFEFLENLTFPFPPPKKNKQKKKRSSFQRFQNLNLFIVFRISLYIWQGYDIISYYLLYINMIYTLYRVLLNFSKFTMDTDTLNRAEYNLQL